MVIWSYAQDLCNNFQQQAGLEKIHPCLFRYMHEVISFQALAGGEI